jgi:enoyl-CoA hydratase/carnithine racemase
MVRDEQRGPARWLTYDDPARRNALTGADHLAVRVAIEGAMADDATRAVVLTGAGSAFSSGADRSLLDGSAPPAERERAGTEFSALLEVLTTCDVPVIAAVNGPAVGFGCTILLHCDLVLAARSARFRFPFTALGVAPEAGSSVLLPPSPGGRWAMLSSEWFDPEQAVTMGLAWRVVDDDELVTAAEAAVASLAAVERGSVAATKRLLTHGRDELVRAAMAREFAAFGQIRPRP